MHCVCVHLSGLLEALASPLLQVKASKSMKQDGLKVESPFKALNSDAYRAIPDCSTALKTTVIFSLVGLKRLNIQAVFLCVSTVFLPITTSFWQH